MEAEVGAAPPGAFYLVLTHRHDLDLRITEAILRRGDFGYLGLIGSRTKRQRFIHRFEQRGVSAAAVGRMTCPIGIEGITGKQPEVLALAVVAQLLRTATAGPLHSLEDAAGGERAPRNDPARAATSSGPGQSAQAAQVEHLHRVALDFDQTLVRQRAHQT